MNLQELFSADFGETLLRFILCLVVNWGIVNFLYFKKSHRRDFYFTFMIISVAIYFLVYLMMGMDRGKATMGVGLGLFGIPHRHNACTRDDISVCSGLSVGCSRHVIGTWGRRQRSPDRYSIIRADSHRCHNCCGDTRV